MTAHFANVEANFFSSSSIFDMPQFVAYVTGVKRLSRRAAHRSLVGVGLSAISGCTLEIPQGPDLQAVVEEYEDPQGVMTEEGLQELIEQAQAHLREVESLSDYRFILESLRDVAQAVNTASQTSQASGLRVKGVVEVVTVCPGFGHLASDDPENGTLEFTVTLKNSKVLDTVWGRFVACRFLRSKEQLEIDSTVDLYLGGDVPLNDFALDMVLFRFRGEVAWNGVKRNREWNFRRDSGGGLELLVPALEGDIVFRADVDASQAAFRTKDGAFCCHFAERYCDALSGDDCSGSASGDQRLRW